MFVSNTTQRCFEIKLQIATLRRFSQLKRMVFDKTSKIKVELVRGKLNNNMTVVINNRSTLKNFKNSMVSLESLMF